MDGFITIFVGILGAVTTLVGVTFANKHNAQQAQVTQYYKFIEQQVSEFYSPILALRAEIVAQSKLAPKLDKIMDEQLKERRPNPEYDDISEDLNRYYRAQFSKLLKSYEQILFVFREKKWLAEDSTINYYESLVEYVEILRLKLDGSTSYTLTGKLENPPDTTKPMFAEMQEQLQKKQQILKASITRTHMKTIEVNSAKILIPPSNKK